MPLASGTRIGPYKIIAPLGSGGMGEVYRAVDSKLGREVAIKILPEAFAQDPERLARFEREAKVLASLNHPHIAQIYGLEDRALVMELVEGENLKGPLPIPTALSYARQIAEALEAAHEKGIVHRDLKPANVRVTPAGIVKVLDFGLAKAADSAGSNDPSAIATLSLPVTQAGMMMGTAAYMSPEQAQGSPADPRADIWSFGAVLFEVLAGKRAFPGKSVSETLVAVLGADPDWSALPVKTPASIRKLLHQCLKKDRQQRLQAIGDARIALQEVDAEPETTVIEQQRTSILPWAIAGAVAVIAGAGWWLEWQATRSVDHPLMRLSVDLGPDSVPGVNTSAAISPDGNRLVFLVRAPDGKPQLATRLLDQSQAAVLAGTEGAYDPFFKPDGEWIGFFAAGKMKKVSVRGGAVVDLCNAPEARGAAWGEDGTIISTLGSDSGVGLSRVSDAGGTPQSLTDPRAKGDATHRWPQLLPGGKAVLFMTNKKSATYDDSSIDVLTLQTGQVKEVMSGGYSPHYLATSKGSGTLVYVHQGTLFGVPFDPDRQELRGTAAPLLDDVAGDANTAGGQFDVSRNGTLVYLSGRASSGTWTLAWLDKTGKTPLLLAAPGLYYHPRFSPNGKQLAFSNGTDIEIYDLGRETLARLNFAGPATNFFPVWTPDGSHIVFQSQGTGSWSLQWIRADGAGEALPLRAGKNRIAPSSFSSDGKTLAFVEQNANTGYDIFTLPLDLSDPERPKAGQPEPFLQTTFDEEHPTFSPDGHWLAYTSQESGREEVYVRPFPAAAGKRTISIAGGQFPGWSRDGRELIYMGADNRVMTVAFDPRNDSGTARPWADAASADVIASLYGLDATPDGKRFAVARATQAASASQSAHVTFLLNFFDEVRRRVPSGK